MCKFFFSVVECSGYREKYQIIINLISCHIYLKGHMLSDSSPASDATFFFISVLYVICSANNIWFMFTVVGVMHHYGQEAEDICCTYSGAT